MLTSLQKEHRRALDEFARAALPALVEKYVAIGATLTGLDVDRIAAAAYDIAEGMYEYRKTLDLPDHDDD